MSAPAPASPRTSILDFNVCCALGMDRESVQRRLLAGESGLAPGSRALPFRTHTGEVRDELAELPEPLGAFDTRLARLSAATIGPLLPGLRERLQGHSPDRVAIVLGSSTAGLDRTERAHAEWMRDGTLPADYSLRTQHDFSAVLAVLAQLTGARGPAWVVSSACSASAQALASASRLLHAGRADLVIAGGVDALCEMTLRGFRSLGILSEQPCRPFGATRDGISMGEGAALFLLGRDEPGCATLLGFGESSDAHHMTAPHPEGRGAEAAMRQALARAALAPEAVDVINAHGTGTPLNDSAESLAVERVFGYDTPILSTKGYTGHTLGACGAIEAALTLLSMQAGVLPASLGADPVDPSLRVPVVTSARSAPLRRALSNSFAFGGSNVSLLFELGR